MSILASSNRNAINHSSVAFSSSLSSSSSSASSSNPIENNVTLSVSSFPSPTLSDSSASSTPSVCSSVKYSNSLKHQRSFVRNQSRHFDTFASNALDPTNNPPFNTDDNPQMQPSQSSHSPWSNQKSQWADLSSFQQGQHGHQGHQGHQSQLQPQRNKQSQALAHLQLNHQYSDRPTNASVHSLQSEEDLILTAIVIKNIPFAIKKEQLLDVLTSLSLPIPYAFNYHFDNGVFRGLAFANFTTPDETTAVINNLNGREIGGRKLRVEYKKMLPLAERERIEREKRERRGQLEEQHRATGKMRQHHANMVATSAPPSPAASALHTTPMSPASKVDLNDPQTLEFYSKILLFTDDKSRSELDFPSNLTHSQRIVLMALSTQFGLHYADQDNGVFVTKQSLAREGLHTSSSATNLSSYGLQQAPQQQQQQQPMLHSQSSYQNLYQQTSQGPQGLQGPQGTFNNNHNALRGTKSFADIRNPIYSSPTIPNASPFFSSQTPPPHQQARISLSLQQQRGYQQYFPQPPAQAHPQPQRDPYSQYGSSFGPSNVGSMTDSFSSLLNVGGSLSRVPSVTNIPGSAGSDSSPTPSISSMHSMHSMEPSASTTKLSSSNAYNAGVIGSKLSGDVNTTND